MYETTWNVDGIDILIESEYVGGRPAPWMNSNENYNIITISANGESQQFDAWGSMVNPEFDDEYSIKNIFQTICDDVLRAMWEAWDEIIYGVDGKRALEIVDSLREEAEKFKNLGLYDEDLLLEIVNDEEWQ